MSKDPDKAINRVNQAWLQSVSTTKRIDPRQRYKLNLMRLRSDADALEESVLELDHTLRDLRKIRDTCASLPRATFRD